MSRCINVRRPCHKQRLTMARTWFTICWRRYTAQTICAAVVNDQPYWNEHVDLVGYRVLYKMALERLFTLAGVRGSGSPHGK